jgi:hypothetical protein
LTREHKFSRLSKKKFKKVLKRKKKFKKLDFQKSLKVRLELGLGLGVNG